MSKKNVKAIANLDKKNGSSTFASEWAKVNGKRPASTLWTVEATLDTDKFGGFRLSVNETGVDAILINAKDLLSKAPDMFKKTGNKYLLQSETITFGVSEKGEILNPALEAVEEEVEEEA